MNDEYITSQKERQILQLTSKTLRIWSEDGIVYLCRLTNVTDVK